MENKELKKLQRKVLRKLNYLSDLYDKHNNITKVEIKKWEIMTIKQEKIKC